MATENLTELYKKIREANSEWPSQVANQWYDVQYDHDADILYMAFGEPREAFSLPTDPPEEDLYIRIDPDSYEIVGFDIMNFKERFLPNHADAQEVFAKLFEVLGELDWCIKMKAPSASQDGELSLLAASPTHSQFIKYVHHYIPTAAPELVPA